MLLQKLLCLLHLMAQALHDPRPRPTLPPLAIGLLCGEKPKTITSALYFLGQDQQGWSNQYRLLSQSHWGPEALFNPLLATALQLHADPQAPFFFAQDDTLLHKTGKKIPGTSYTRDPLSPPFHTNLVRGQRFLQTSFLLRQPGATQPSRSIPVAFRQAPPLQAPKNSSQEIKAQVIEWRKKHNLSTVAAEEAAQLRLRLDTLGWAQRLMVLAVDGSFTNKTYLRSLPNNTTVVGRIRKDAQLRMPLPLEQRSANRKYHPQRFTPQQLLQDPSAPFYTFPVFVAGEIRSLHYKCFPQVCWPKATLDRPLMLIVIKAPGYRLRKNSRLLYRQPAFLVVTDADFAPQLAMEAYLARWEVEVNFREEKTTLGVGQAQVWNQVSVYRTPAFLVAGYAALLLASLQAFDDQRSEAFDPLPKWRNQPPLRPSLRDLIRMLRSDWQQYSKSLGQAA